jgi:predicted transcriptional regulator
MSEYLRGITTTQIPLNEAIKKEYRGRHEIIVTILSTIKDSGNEGATKISIMYKSFLSRAQLKEYLSFFIERGLVEEIHRRVKSGNEKSVYKITDKGSRLLQITLYQIESLVGLDKIVYTD